MILLSYLNLLYTVKYSIMTPQNETRIKHEDFLHCDTHDPKYLLMNKCCNKPESTQHGSNEILGVNRLVVSLCISLHVSNCWSTVSRDCCDQACLAVPHTILHIVPRNGASFLAQSTWRTPAVTLIINSSTTQVTYLRKHWRTMQPTIKLLTDHKTLCTELSTAEQKVIDTCHADTFMQFV